MIVCSLIPFHGRYPYGIEGIHLWFFYKTIWIFQDELKHVAFCGSSENMTLPRDLAENAPWSSFLNQNFMERFGYQFLPEESLEKLNRTEIPSHFFDPLLKEKHGSAYQVWRTLITEPYSPLVDFYEQYLDRLSSKEPIEMVLTLCNDASMSLVTARRGIPFIHSEIGPLREPDYQSTFYWDLSGVNGCTECKKRYQESRELSFSSDVLSRKELLFLFCKDNSRYAKLIAEPKAERKVGIVGQVDDDSNLIAYSEGFSNFELIRYAAYHFGKENILLRRHPSADTIISGEYDASPSVSDFIQRVDSILCINSSVGLEAAMLGKKVMFLGDSPFRILSTDLTSEDNEIPPDFVDMLNFILLNYLVPSELAGSPAYSRWRLTNPSEIEIRRKHLEFYLKNRGFDSLEKMKAVCSEIEPQISQEVLQPPFTIYASSIQRQLGIFHRWVYLMKDALQQGHAAYIPEFKELPELLELGEVLLTLLKRNKTIPGRSVMRWLKVRREELVIARSKVFDEEYYRQTYSDIVRSFPGNMIRHYCRLGWQQGLNPSAAFNTNAYLEANPDVRAAGINPLFHYISKGKKENRSLVPVAHLGNTPEEEIQLIRDSGLFDVNFYLNLYEDVSAGKLDPIRHYHECGWKEGRNPSASFNTRSYLAANPDVKTANVDPLLHYICFGQTEERKLHPDDAQGKLHPDPYFPDNDTAGNYVLKNQQNEFTAEELEEATGKLKISPLISIIMPLYNAPLKWFEIVLKSIQQQSYKNWELCLTDDASTDRRCVALATAYAEKDPRIKLFFNPRNGGISKASNISLEHAKGEYLVLIDQDDEITPDAFFRLLQKLEENPDADLIYSDECKITTDTPPKCYDFLFKPDWSPCFLINYMYTGHLSLYRTEFVRKLGGFRSQFDFSQDYDLALRTASHTNKVYHVERVLYFWRAVPTSGAGGGKPMSLISNISALQTWYDENGFSAVVERRPFGNYAKRIFDKPPMVSIIIPSDSLKNLRILIPTLFAGTSYNNIELLPVVNSVDAKKLLDEFPYHAKRLRPVCYDDIFNFSAKCNSGAESAKGEIFCFYNDYALPHNADWLERLLDLIDLPQVGAVSPLMLYEDGKSIQYAGMHVLHNFFGFNGPTFFRENFSMLEGLNSVNSHLIRETTCISGACFIVRREIFRKVGGFDAKNTPNGHSDLDFGFRLLENGLHSVYTPYSMLIHPGKGTWTVKFKKDSATLFCINKWRKYLERDSFYTPSMQTYHEKTLNKTSLFYPVDFDPKAVKRGNLLLVTHELSRTGAPVVMQDTARILVQSGYNVVMASPSDGPLRKELQEAGSFVWIDPNLNREDFSTQSSFQAHDYFIAEFDLVIVCCMVNHRYIRRYIDIPIPIIWWLHEGPFTLTLLKHLIPQTLGKNMKVYCGGEYVWKSLRDFGFSFPAKILLYGIADRGNDKLKPIRNPKIRFLLAGSYEYRKGQTLFIEAIKLLPPELQDKTEFMFVGKIHELHVYNAVKAFCDITPNATCYLPVTREELFEIYQQTTCVVAPSYDDPMPVVMTEAMMFSKICICSDHTGTASFIKNGENGFVFPCGNAQAFADCMEAVIRKDKALNAVRQASRKIYVENFEESIFRRNILHIVEESIDTGEDYEKFRQ